jgi:hypothetical protein
VTTALKFLRPGRVGPFTGAVWPQPGAWLESRDEPQLCRSGIHALRPEALPFWLAEELWRVELDDARSGPRGMVLARRGRLLERVGAWNDGTARAFAESCLRSLPDDLEDGVARERRRNAVQAARDVGANATAAAVAYITAKAAEAHRPGGYDEERARQASWLEQQLGLEQPVVT